MSCQAALSPGKKIPLSKTVKKDQESSFRQAVREGLSGEALCGQYLTAQGSEPSRSPGQEQVSAFPTFPLSSGPAHHPNPPHPHLPPTPSHPLPPPSPTSSLTPTRLCSVPQGTSSPHLGPMVSGSWVIFPSTSSPSGGLGLGLGNSLRA